MHGCRELSPSDIWRPVIDSINAALVDGENEYLSLGMCEMPVSKYRGVTAYGI